MRTPWRTRCLRLAITDNAHTAWCSRCLTAACTSSRQAPRNLSMSGCRHATTGQPARARSPSLAVSPTWSTAGTASWIPSPVDDQHPRTTTLFATRTVKAYGVVVAHAAVSRRWQQLCAQTSRHGQTGRSSTSGNRPCPRRFPACMMRRRSWRRCRNMLPT